MMKLTGASLNERSASSLFPGEPDERDLAIPLMYSHAGYI
jgi:hypothetical protein